MKRKKQNLEETWAKGESHRKTERGNKISSKV